MDNTNRKNKAGWNLDNSYSRLPEFFFSVLNPNPVPHPHLIIFNQSLCELLGLDADALKNKDGLAILSGNQIPKGSVPLAQAYAGHQFGHFTKLGDGRAMLLGEQITPENNQVDIQLKGSGRTPYSRGGDGRATLGPMLREYIISEAMHNLGIPTTRSLAVVTTGEPVLREKDLPGAVLTRIASSHLRVGTFEYASAWGSIADLQAIADYAIQRHFPQLKDYENPYLSFLKEVIRRQASLIAKWQLVGFIHGVMNTDNMTISGETIDYGPCAFMDAYDPATVFSSIDTRGRYAYGNQPVIGEWNLIQFARTLIPLLDHDGNKAVEIAQEAISEYTTLYENYWMEGMRAKLGLVNEKKEDKDLIKDLLHLMHKYQADYTNTFVALTFSKKHFPLFKKKEFTDWQKRWEKRRNQQEPKDLAVQQMKKSNPAVIPRNHRVEEALQAAVKEADYSIMHQLLGALSCPYEHSNEHEAYAELPPDTFKGYKTYCGT